ncbi:MAG: nucleotidyl transferase AbiEii/AbiGii toxin family protein [bacterium]|nr:nucleotidyl transferase AbiEii/AbiGii toxin family protein [bacterium]
MDSPTCAVERDRIQHFLLAALAARERRRHRLVLKGGTLLRTCWKMDYRYSEDLDFDWSGHSSAERHEIVHTIENVLDEASRASGRSLRARDRSGRLDILWEAPADTRHRLRIDITVPDAPPRDGARLWRLQPRYPGLGDDIRVTGITLEAITAAKLACLAHPSRLAARDLYDLDRLLDSPDVDCMAALDSFLASDSDLPDIASQPENLLECLLDSTYTHLDVLSGDWANMRRTQLIAPNSPALDELIDSVHAKILTLLRRH